MADFPKQAVALTCSGGGGVLFGGGTEQLQGFWFNTLKQAVALTCSGEGGVLFGGGTEQLQGFWFNTLKQAGALTCLHHPHTTPNSFRLPRNRTTSGF